MSTLTRDAIVAHSKEKSDFAARCASLGYTPLQRDCMEDKWRQTLGELNMAPLNARAVQEYKDKTARAARAPEAKVDKLIGAAAGLTAGTIFCAVAMLLFNCGPGVLWWMPAVAILAGLICYGGPMQGFESQFEWVQTALHDYTEPVPRFALQTALDIQEKLDAEDSSLKVRFFVETLRRKRDTTRGRSGTLDPFLLATVHHGSTFVGRFHLEVWDEPGFNLEREV